MIRIDITKAAFDALAATLPSSDTYELELDGRGQPHVWLPPFVVDRLRFLRGPGERRCHPSADERLVSRFASVVDAERPRLLALGKLKQEIGSRASPCFATSLRDDRPYAIRRPPVGHPFRPEHA